MEIRFYREPGVQEPHFLRHGIAEEEVLQAVRSPVEDRRGKDGARVLIGRTVGGRFLRIIYVLDPDGRSIFVVTAYELTGKPLWALRRRRRRKQ